MTDSEMGQYQSNLNVGGKIPRMVSVDFSERNQFSSFIRDEIEEEDESV